MQAMGNRKVDNEGNAKQTAQWPRSVRFRLPMTWPVAKADQKDWTNEKWPAESLFD